MLDVNHKNITAVEAKRQIKNLLEKGKRKVISKKPCLRINYANFHVDLAIYSESLDANMIPINWQEVTREVLKANKNGKMHSPNIYKNGSKDSFTEAKDKEQIKRVIRILKRWKDVNFKSEKRTSYWHCYYCMCL